MGKILNNLEELLKKQVLEGETLKTWPEWSQWLETKGYPYKLKCPPQMKEDQPVNYQTMLVACEQQINTHPEWKAKLGTPSWLQRHRIKLASKELRKKEGGLSGGVDLNSLYTELTNLVDQIHTIQQKLVHLESGRVTDQPSLAQEISQASQPLAGLGAGARLLGRPETTLLLQRELGITSLEKKESPLPEDKDRVAKIVPLKEAYLSFNRWVDQFDDIHLDLKPFFQKPLRVASSHEISFVQFCHRLQRETNDPEALKKDLDAFERLRKNGVDENLRETLPEATAVEQEIKRFTPPSNEIYHNFQDWIRWLKNKGIDASEFTTQDLDSLSSHPISFPQFCRRLERRLDNPEGFRQLVEPA